MRFCTYVIPVHAKKPAKLLLFFDMTKFLRIFFAKSILLSSWLAENNVLTSIKYIYTKYIYSKCEKMCKMSEVSYGYPMGMLWVSYGEVWYRSGVKYRIES